MPTFSNRPVNMLSYFCPSSSTIVTSFLTNLLPNIVGIAPQIGDAERDDPLVAGLVAGVVVLVLRQIGVSGPYEPSLQKFWNTKRK